MDYEIVYSGRKTLSLSVKGGRLVIRAPFGTRKEKIDKAIAAHREWIVTHLEEQRIKQARINALTEEDVASLKKKAREVLTARTEYFAKKMGLEYGRISITSAMTRFGSCNSKGNIAFSYRLMLYPEEAIDYVVVHELAHLVEMNHSPRFYRVVEAILPDYRKRKELLKK